jgi:hypothetical protein
LCLIHPRIFPLSTTSPTLFSQVPSPSSRSFHDLNIYLSTHHRDSIVTPNDSTILLLKHPHLFVNTTFHFKASHAMAPVKSPPQISFTNWVLGGALITRSSPRSSSFTHRHIPVTLVETVQVDPKSKIQVKGREKEKEGQGDNDGVVSFERSLYSLAPDFEDEPANTWICRLFLKA